jgi:hypothetical protein
LGHPDKSYSYGWPSPLLGGMLMRASAGEFLAKLIPIIVLTGMFSFYSVSSSWGSILHSGVVTVAKICEASFVKPIQIGDTPPNIDELLGWDGDTMASPFRSATWPVARQRPLRDARIGGGEVSF